MILKGLPFALLLMAIQAGAATVTEDFSTTAQSAGGTAFWNTALGKVHSTIKITGYGGADKTVDYGDGSDGAFVRSRYAYFSKNGDLSGNIIRLDQTKFSELNVTEFVLESGWFLEPADNAHLVIRSLSNVTIEGEIWCHGHDGSADSGAGVGGSGGEGRCGGARGGDGGDSGFAGDDGGDSTSPVTGGSGGSANGGGAGMDGGGGGAWSTSTVAQPGNAGGSTGVAGSPGAKGNSSSDPIFATIAGGAGGGGGGSGSGAAGAGGGGGGGVVIIHAVGDVTIGSSSSSTIGFIRASGGNGADSTGNGGAGAGGGGGSVQIFSGGTLYLYSDTGIGASRAMDGKNAGSPSGGIGRSWITSRLYSASGFSFYEPSEELPVNAGDWARFETSAQYVDSKSYDLRSTRADVTAITTSPSSSDFSLQWRGSSDEFASDDTGWSTNLAVLSQKRYIKFRFTVTTSSGASPVFLDSVSITYNPGTRDNFEFKSSAGCARIDGGGGAGSHSALLLVLPFFFLIFFRFKMGIRR